MESLNDNPLAIIIMPSVTMNGGMRKAVIMKPLKAPAEAQTATSWMQSLAPISSASITARPPMTSSPRCHVIPFFDNRKPLNQLTTMQSPMPSAAARKAE